MTHPTATRVPTGAVLFLAAVLTSGCAGAGPPRYVERTERSAAPVATEQSADLAGQLLTAPPERSSEVTMREYPEAALPLVGLGESAPPPVVPVELPPAPDTTAVAGAVTAQGAYREYQVQVAITPSAEEAEDLVEHLRPLLPEEEVFVFFTRPYYRIRVGRKATRVEAEALLPRLTELGYTRALVIPVTVTPEDPPPQTAGVTS